MNIIVVAVCSFLVKSKSLFSFVDKDSPSSSCHSRARNIPRMFFLLFTSLISLISSSPCETYQMKCQTSLGEMVHDDADELNPNIFTISTNDNFYFSFSVSFVLLFLFSFPSHSNLLATIKWRRGEDLNLFILW
jgi:hypothetical protein